MKSDEKIREIKRILEKHPKVLDSLPLMYKEIVKKIRDMDTEKGV